MVKTLSEQSNVWMDQWHNLVGGIGVVMVLVAYFMLQSGRMDLRHWPFSLLNALGSLLILLSLSVDYNLPAVLIEAFWLLISLYGLWRCMARPARSAP